MKTIKVSGIVDEQHRLVADVPAEVSPGRVEVLLVVPPPGPEAAGGAPGGPAAPALVPPPPVAAQPERREQDRIDFIQPVRVLTADGQEHHVLSRDLSPSGIRLIASRSLLGQKIDVLIPGTRESEATWFRVRVLWTCVVGDDLFENGGMFVDGS